MGRLFSDNVIMQNAVQATGNGTEIDVSGLATLGLQVKGTFVGTVTFEGSIDGSTWVAIQGANLNDGSVVSTATAPGLFIFTVAGLQRVRARVSAYTSGSITIVGFGTAAGGGQVIADVDIAGSEVVTLGAAIPAGTNAIGKLAANSGVDIGDVDVLSLPALAAGTNAIGKLAANAGVDIGDVGAKSYTTIASGERAGSITAVQLPNVVAKLLKIKATKSNTGDVYIGGAGVTVPDGTTDTTSGLELAPGEETGWLAVDNLNRFYMICDAATDDITYLVLS